MVEGYLRHPSRALVKVPTGWPLSTLPTSAPGQDTAGMNAPGLLCPAKETVSCTRSRFPSGAPGGYALAKPKPSGASWEHVPMNPNGCLRDRPYALTGRICNACAPPHTVE